MSEPSRTIWRGRVCLIPVRQYEEVGCVTSVGQYGDAECV